MRLVFVHGRGQGGGSEASLVAAWTESLRAGLDQIGRPLSPAVEIRLPFYGAALDRLTQEHGFRSLDVRGATPADDFERDVLAAYAKGLGIDEAEVEREAGPAYRALAAGGVGDAEWVQALLRLIERRAPGFTSEVLGRLLPDVNAYLRRRAVRSAIDGIVGEAIEGSEALVVSHSLGTVVAYEVLVALAGRADVPLWVTLGSPLGLVPIQRHLTTPLGKPPPVRRWVNAADERDTVALHARLEGDAWPGGVDLNYSRVQNGEDAHAIEDYLRDTVVDHEVAAALA